MNVSIGERWERFVESAVKSGRYGSASVSVWKIRRRGISAFTITCREHRKRIFLTQMQADAREARE
jgi:Arc/MetJ-type ribon-helix-helix transcriptional regulator